MLNIFKKRHKDEFIKFMSDYNFYYLKEEKKFVGFYDDLVFRIGFDISGYGSRMSMLFESYMPLLDEEFTVFPKGMAHNYEITVFKWSLEIKKLPKEEKDSVLHEYLEDMKYIVKNYIYYVNSATVNSFALESYLWDKYQSDYRTFLRKNNKEDGASVYRGDFIDSGKTHADYTDEDEKIAQFMEKKQREEEFPYAPIKKNILKNVDKNRATYEAIKDEYLKKTTGYIKIDSAIKPLESTDEFLYKSSYGKLIIKCLEAYGYVHDNRHFFVESNVFRHKEDENCRVKVLFKHKLFLSFIIYVKNEDPQITQTGANFFKRVDCIYEPEEVASYVNKPFSIGWIIGDKTKIKENIDLAINALKEKLEEIK